MIEVPKDLQRMTREEFYAEVVKRLEQERDGIVAAIRVLKEMAADDLT